MQIFRLKWSVIGTIADALTSMILRLFFYWPFSWRVVSTLIFGVLLAHWFWVLFAPHTTYTTTVPEYSAELQAGQLFGVAVSTEVASQGIALLNVKLLGVFAASAGKAGFAVLKLDDKRQLGVVEGEEVASGTRLAAVQADHVILERAGIKQRINLENNYSDQPNNSVTKTYSTETHDRLIKN